MKASQAADDRRFVYAIARRIVATAEDAEDCAQDALLLAYRHRGTFRGDSQYRTWLYRIAATTALGLLRRQRRSRRRFVGSDRAGVETHPDPARSVLANIEDAEDRALAQQAVSSLPTPYRDVLLARTEASEQEVAAKLGITVANVKIRAHRARKLLREAFGRVATTRSIQSAASAGAS